MIFIMHTASWFAPFISLFDSKTVGTDESEKEVSAAICFKFFEK